MDHGFEIMGSSSPMITGRKFKVPTYHAKVLYQARFSYHFRRRYRGFLIFFGLRILTLEALFQQQLQSKGMSWKQVVEVIFSLKGGRNGLVPFGTDLQNPIDFIYSQAL